MTEDTQLYAGGGGQGQEAPVPDVDTRVGRVPACLARAVADVVQVTMFHWSRLAACHQPTAGPHILTI